jgi:hypothetical protein
MKIRLTESQYSRLLKENNDFGSLGNRITHNTIKFFKFLDTQYTSEDLVLNREKIIEDLKKTVSLSEKESEILLFNYQNRWRKGDKNVEKLLGQPLNWVRSRRTIGFREVITIPGIGDIVAKFDTGNGSLSCSLTYDESKLSEDKKSVIWELGGNKFNNKVIGYSNAEVGHVVQERPIIKMDIIFAGKTYKDVHVSLVDRKEKSTKFLVNRNFMERIGCSVSPSKTFVVSSFDGEYSTMDAKGNNHTGIKFEK